MPSVSSIVAAAICGNFWQESSINPAIWQSLQAGTWTDLGKGYGLGQWTNTGGDTHGRLYRLHEYLSTNGYADDSGNGQIAYIPVENVWHYHSEYPFNNLSDFLSSTSTDLTMLTHAWNRCWEGIHDSSWDVRVTYAYRCYNYITSHGTDSLTWVKGNRYLSDSERLNNAVLVYQALGGTPAPEPPKPPHPVKNKKKHMPVWMMCKPRY